jgi:hypothetical protein
MTPMSCPNSSNDGGGNVAICLQREAGGVGVSCHWRTGGALEMEVSLITGGCSNVGITYTATRDLRIRPLEKRGIARF